MSPPEPGLRAPVPVTQPTAGTTHADEKSLARHVTSGSLHCTHNTVGQMNIPPTALSTGCRDKKRLRDNAKVLGGEHRRRGSGNPLAEPHSLPPQGLHLHKLLTFLQSGFLTQGNINGGGRVRATLFFKKEIYVYSVEKRSDSPLIPIYSSQCTSL